MRNLLLLICLASIIGGCHVNHGRAHAYSSGTHRKQLKYIPSELRNLYLGMPYLEAIEARPGMEEVPGDSFRRQFIESIEHPQIEDVVYYFDADGDQPLYEFIIIYKDMAVRDAAAKELFGDPNYENGKEWLYKSGDGFDIHAWKFEKKLVIVGKIVGTEWEPGKE